MHHRRERDSEKRKSVCVCVRVSSLKGINRVNKATESPERGEEEKKTLRREIKATRKLKVASGSEPSSFFIE